VEEKENRNILTKSVKSTNDATSIYITDDPMTIDEVSLKTVNDSFTNLRECQIDSIDNCRVKKDVIDCRCNFQAHL